VRSILKILQALNLHFSLMADKFKSLKHFCKVCLYTFVCFFVVPIKVLPLLVIANPSSQAMVSGSLSFKDFSGSMNF
jgi:hypothetical protein